MESKIGKEYLKHKNNGSKKELKKIFNFSSDYVRLLSEYVAFASTFLFIEIFSGIALNYVMEFQYILMFFITITFIFLQLILLRIGKQDSQFIQFFQFLFLLCQF